MIALVGRTKEEMDYARMLGATIKERREKLHARQVDLAAVMGITATTLSRWETGSAMPTAWHLRRLSEELDLDADLLLYPPEQVPTGDESIFEVFFQGVAFIAWGLAVLSVAVGLRRG